MDRVFLPVEVVEKFFVFERLLYEQHESLILRLAEVDGYLLSTQIQRHFPVFFVQIQISECIRETDLICGTRFH
jgi:hypothetical protein